jgi:hypothetical protein
MDKLKKKMHKATGDKKERVVIFSFRRPTMQKSNKRQKPYKEAQIDDGYTLQAVGQRNFEKWPERTIA